jgi:hypothetical protein
MARHHADGRPEAATGALGIDAAAVAAAIGDAHRVPGQTCRLLLAEIEHEAWADLPERVGPVRQAARELVLHPPRTPPTLTTLTGLIEAAAAFAASPLAVNEMIFMRYDRPDGGISPHRDHACYQGAIVLFTLEGAAPFRIHRSRDIDDVAEAWTTGPGDVVVLRAASADDIGGRPMHSVGPPEGRARVSLSLRHRVAS